MLKMRYVITYIYLYLQKSIVKKLLLTYVSLPTFILAKAVNSSPEDSLEAFAARMFSLIKGI